MRCPFCGADDDRVVDSRAAEGGETVRRRRECAACGQRFSTLERVEMPTLVVRKRDGRLEPFDPERVLGGMRKATANLDIGPEAVRHAAAAVEARLRAAGRREITSEAVGTDVLAALRELHEVAYLRFASVYKGFTSGEDFARELRTLESRGGDPDRER